MLRNNYDKVIFAISVLVVIGLSVVFFQRGQQIVEELDTEIPIVENIHQHEMTPQVDLDLEVRSWAPPEPQSAGPEWVYEVFTPPRIYYHEEQDRFVPTPPGPRVDPEDVIRVEFVGFEEQPYRIQLTGYAGREGDYLITLLNRETGEMIVTRQGREIPDAEIRIEGFRVDRRENNGVVSRVARAVLFDQRSGEEVTLREEETLYLDEPAIVVRTNEDPPRTINARLDEWFEVGEHVYRVVEYAVDPPRIELERRSLENEESETETLSPGERF